MKLYIGNATKQHQDFVYNVPIPGTDRFRAIGQRIEIGQQVQISGDLSRARVDDIIQQHARYGLVAVTEIEYVNDFVGLCYSVDTPIRADKMHRLMLHNVGVLAERGREIRKESSIASNDHLESTLNESGHPANLKFSEISIVEEDADRRNNNDSPMAEGYRVQRGARQNPNQPPPPSRRSRRKAA